MGTTRPDHQSHRQVVEVHVHRRLHRFQSDSSAPGLAWILKCLGWSIRNPPQQHLTLDTRPVNKMAFPKNSQSRGRALIDTLTRPYESNKRWRAVGEDSAKRKRERQSYLRTRSA